MGTAVIALSDQFRRADFSQSRRVPKALAEDFAGFFGSLETVNDYLRTGGRRTRRSTPAHLL
jgi:hypothetical protein